MEKAEWVEKVEEARNRRCKTGGRGILAASCTVLALFLSFPSFATDVYVAEDGEDAAGRGSELQPFATLPYALASLDGADGTIHLAAGTFVVNTNLDLTAAVTIVGAGVGQTFITREGTKYSGKKLFVLKNAGASVTDLTVTGVYANDIGGTGGAMFEFPQTTGAGSIARLVVTGCTAGSAGAGYVCYIGSKASATVEDVVFRGNTMRASGGSGVLYANGATSATVTRCAFISNENFATGALRVNGACTVSHCTFADNRTTLTNPVYSKGGAIYIDNVWNTAMSFSDCVFFSDHAWYDSAEMAPELNVAANNVAARFTHCAWDTRVAAIGTDAIAITESAFTDVYSCDFSPHANSPLVTASGTIGAFAASSATGPAYTPTGPAEINLAENASINDAIKAAPDGQVINLAEGKYSVTGMLWIAKKLTLKGAGRDKTFLLRASGYDGQPYLRLEHPEAYVSGVTISNVNAKANSQAGALFVTARGGTFADSRIVKCQGAGPSTGAVVGLAGGTNSVVTRCILNENSDYGSSGNSIVYLWGGVLDNTLVWKNSNITQGAISLRGAGQVRNCTVADNTCRSGNTQFVCAGIYWLYGSNFDPRNARVFNTIVTRGTAASDSSTGAPLWYRSGGNDAQFQVSFSNCAWGATSPGGATAVPTVNQTSDVTVTDDGFTDAEAGDYHIKTSSAAFEAGMTYPGLAATDLDGKVRVSGETPDIGCYEANAYEFAVEIKVSPTAGFVGDSFLCQPIVTGLAPGKSYSCKWRFHNESVAEADIVSTSTEYLQTLSTPGVRTVELEVFDEVGDPLGTAPPQSNYVNVAVRECYLADPADDTVTPAYPHDTAATAAKTNLAAMVAASVPGQTIHVLAGKIDFGGAVQLSDIRVVGLGWDKTVLTNSPYHAKAERDPFLIVNGADTLLSRLCISNVLTYSNGPSVLELGASGGTVSWVKLSKCRGGSSGNGYIAEISATNAVMKNCWLDDCTVQPNGSCGGLYVSKGIVESTLVDKINAIHTGGGIIAGGEEAIFRNVTVVRCNKSGNTWANGSFAGIVFYNSGYAQTTCGRFVNCVSVSNETAAVVGIGGSAWRGCENRTDLIARSAFNCAFSTDAAEVGMDCVLVSAAQAFRNSAKADWRPRTSSPLYERGLYEEWMSDAKDVRGQPRATTRRTVEMGALQANHGKIVFLTR